MADAFIVEAVRTAGGRCNGKLAGWHPADMSAEGLNALVAGAGIDPAAVEDVIMGCVSQVGEQSFHIGRNTVMSGTQDVVIAAGVESLSRVPMGSPTVLVLKANLGGPWSERILSRYRVTEFSQFVGAQTAADKHAISREHMDAFALQSHQRAAAASRNGAFSREIVPLAIDVGLHTADEGIRADASLQSIGADPAKLNVNGGAIALGHLFGASGTKLIMPWPPQRQPC